MSAKKWLLGLIVLMSMLTGLTSFYLNQYTSTISDPTTRFEQALYRLALAQALLAKGELVLADEPTGSLDLNLRNQVAELFIKPRSLGKTVVIVSHDPYFKEISDQVIELK